MSLDLSENSCPSEVFKNVFFIKVTVLTFLKNQGITFMCQTTEIVMMPTGADLGYFLNEAFKTDG